jgi:hypothetical protein
MKLPAILLSLCFAGMSPSARAAIAMDYRALSLSDIEATGISFSVEGQFSDGTPTGIIVLLDRVPNGAEFKEMGFSIWDHPIDAAFAEQAAHKNAEFVRGGSSKKRIWHFAVSGRELDHGYFFINYIVQNFPEGRGLLVRRCLLLNELRKKILANKISPSTTPTVTPPAGPEARQPWVATDI